MKKNLVLIAGGLALLGAGAAAAQWRSAPVVPAPQRPAPASAAAEPPSPAVATPTRSEADLALEVVRGYAELLRAEEGRLDAARKELVDSKEREIRSRAARLTQALRADPGAWVDVLDLLGGFEPVEAAIRAGRQLQEAVDPAVERRLVELLGRGSSSGARRVALSLLGSRDSGEIVSALLAALQDADPRLRADALDALAARRAQPDSPAAAAPVDAVLRRRADVEPDPVLRQTERSLAGEVLPKTPSIPARRTALSSRGIGPKPAAGATAASP